MTYQRRLSSAGVLAAPEEALLLSDTDSPAFCALCYFGETSVCKLSNAHAKSESAEKSTMDAVNDSTTTTAVSRMASSRVGQVTLRSSLWVSRANFIAAESASHFHTPFELLFAVVMIYCSLWDSARYLTR